MRSDPTLAIAGKEIRKVQKIIFKLLLLLKSLKSRPILKLLIIVAVKTIRLNELTCLRMKPAIVPITITRSNIFQGSMVNRFPQPTILMTISTKKIKPKIVFKFSVASVKALGYKVHFKQRTKVFKIIHVVIKISKRLS